MKLPGPLNMEQDKHLRTVQTSAKHLLSLINDLLDVVKIEAGKVELTIIPVDCCVVLDEIATSLRQLAEAKGLSFILSLPQQPLILHTDQRALSQIIINLANNAIKFTEQGTINIKVLRRKVRGEKTIEISVTDTGVGISLDDQARLFKSFERLNVSIQSAKEGTGLGLHLSQKLAQELGGKISVRSKPGVGSTFTLVLPEL
jgi:protein-histidine pros-kinase